jgi:hypothetical protein
VPFCVSALEKALAGFGTPEIFNTSSKSIGRPAAARRKPARNVRRCGFSARQLPKRTPRR